MTMPIFTDGQIVHQGDLNALSTGINNLATYMLGATLPRSYVPMIKLQRAAAQTIPTGTDTLVSWDTVVGPNNDTMWVASQPTTVSIKTAGSYVVLAQGSLATNTTGSRYMQILLNGTDSTTNAVAMDNQAGANWGDGNMMRAAVLLPGLSAGSTIYLNLWQNSGGNLSTLVGRGACTLSVWRVGP